MDTKDIIMVAAVIAGPILAVQAQKIIEGLKESKSSKVKVFKDLMATRAAVLAFQHVVALNMVGLEFKGKKYNKVLDLWKSYLDQLSSYPKIEKDGKDFDTKVTIWTDKKNELLSELLYEMGKSLGFNFDMVHIKKAGYMPQAYIDQEIDQLLIRKALVEVLSGTKTLPINILGDSGAGEIQQQLQQMLVKYYKGLDEGKPTLVKIVKEE
jgi:predicted aconitase with swiveling domain